MEIATDALDGLSENYVISETNGTVTLTSSDSTLGDGDHVYSTPSGDQFNGDVSSPLDQDFTNEGVIQDDAGSV